MTSMQTLVEEPSHPIDAFHGRTHVSTTNSDLRVVIRKLQPSDVRYGLEGRPGIDYRIQDDREPPGILTPEEYHGSYIPLPRTDHEMALIRLYEWLKSMGVPVVSNTELQTDFDAEGVALRIIWGFDSSNPTAQIYVRGGGENSLGDCRRVVELLQTIGINVEFKRIDNGLYIEFPLSALDTATVARAVDPGSVPEVVFDASVAVRIFPRPIVKNAAIVTIPITSDGSELPVFIKPEWGGVQVFYGSFYLIINSEGGPGYGSARKEWEDMHFEVRPNYWVKTGVPTAYQATAPCSITTHIPSDDGGVREAIYVLEVGDWIVRQPAGEVQHVKARQYGRIYFSQEEAKALGLNEMSAEAFADWAVAQAPVAASA